MRCPLVLIALAALSCRVEFGPGAARAREGEAGPGELWVYTSMYRQVLERLEPLCAARWPSLRVHWFQGGSEKVAARMEAELLAGGTRADVVLTSDPFWYERLAREGRFLPHVPPGALRMPAELSDLDGRFTTARVSTMVIAYDRRRVKEEEAPRRWTDLALPRWKGKVAMPDPLQSGTTFTTVALLSRELGWEFFRALGRNGAVASGGNSVVIGKLEAGEADVGIVLLENVLASRTGSLSVVYPEEGPVIVPGHAGILATTRNTAAARAFVDFLFSPEGQRAVAEVGLMHSADGRVPPPPGAPPWSTLYPKSVRWSEAVRVEIASQVAEIKARFQREFFR